jgi:hypothetical protein
VSTRSRIIWFGSCGVLVVAGVLFEVLLGGLAGDLLAIGLLLIGLGGALLLLFYEVGLSEDRELEREDAARRREHEREERRTKAPRRRPTRFRRRPG